VTRALVFLTLGIYVLQIIPGSPVTGLFAFQPARFFSEPWRALTAGFVHDDSLFYNPSSILHVGFNLYSLYIFGQVLEPVLGKMRFFWLYLASIVGGSIAVLLFSDPLSVTVGASGGVFGLMGSYFVVMRAIGRNSSQIMGLIAINLVFSFLMPGISWQGHLGGLIVGAIVTYGYTKVRKR
jgi:membrane associated rhomboid family serine protease